MYPFKVHDALSEKGKAEHKMWIRNPLTTSSFNHSQYWLLASQLDA
jgi:hypothetical protein